MISPAPHTTLPTPLPPPLPPPSHDVGLQFHTKIKYLNSLNLNTTTLLHKHPLLRSSPLPSLLAVETTLTHHFLLPRSSLSRLFDMFPHLLTSSPSLHLLPLLRFLLRDVSLPPHSVSPAVLRCPRLLVSDLDSQLLPTLLFLRRKFMINFTPRTTVLLVSSVENTLLPKVEYLEGELGFTEAEVVSMVRRCPALLTYSVENNFRRKVEYFVEVMKGDLRELSDFPQFFAFSLRNRIVPRHRMLVEVGVRMSLRDMLTVSDGEFQVGLLDLRLQRGGFDRIL